MVEIVKFATLHVTIPFHLTHLQEVRLEKCLKLPEARF